MTKNSYIERVERFVVEYHDEFPVPHKAEMRLKGIDPDNVWNLMWSFSNQGDAVEAVEFEIIHAPSYRTFRMRDIGQPVEVRRTAIF